MSSSILSKDIKAERIFQYLHAQEENLSCIVVLAVAISPLIEMLYCMVDRAERLLPVSFYPFLILKVVQPISILLGSLVIISFVYQLKPSGKRVKEVLTANKAYSFFIFAVCWIIISTAINGTAGSIFFGDMYHNESVSLIISYFFIFFFCASRIFSPEKKELLASVSVVVSIALGIYSIVFYFTNQEILKALGGGYLKGIFTNSNHYGYYLCVHIMIGAGLFVLGSLKQNKYIGLVGLIFNTVVLSYNNTFGAWLACFCAFIFLIIVLHIVYKRTNAKAILSFVIFIGTTFVMNFFTPGIFSSIIEFVFDVKMVALNPELADAAGSSRWLIWKITLGEIAKSPVFGFGNEGIDDVIEAATGSCTRPHNEFLQYAAFFGIPTSIAYISGALSVFLNGYRNRESIDNATLICLTGAFSYLVSSTFGNTMYYTTPFLFIFLGMGYFRDTMKKEYEVDCTIQTRGEDEE